MKYPVVIHKDADSDYGVTVPDLPGCFSAGTSFEEALEMAREAAELHLEGMLEDGMAVPEPSPIKALMGNPDYAGGVWALIEVDLSKLSGKTRRINITLPEQVLALIDEAARRSGESLSGYLARVALEAAGRENPVS
jgi:predicted RNase H-like HicB family nuclease